jgi:hypothetical protein
MALSSTIAADFSEFVGECKKADAGLASIEKASKQTEAALTEMGSTGTASVTKTATAITEVGTTAAKSQDSFGQMASGLKVADKALGAFGVNVSQEIGILEDLSSVLTKGVSTLGAFGTAAAIAGAAMAAFKLTQVVREVTDADKKFAEFGSQLMGWGSVSSETLMARVDVVRRAIEQGYEGVPKFEEALKFLNERVKDNYERTNTAANRVATWNTELQNARHGGVAALRAEIESGNSTTAQMAQHFKVSAEAVQYLEREMRKATAATKEQEAAQKKAAAEAQAQADALIKLREAMFGTDTIAKAQQYVTALGPIENLTRMSTEAQASMNTELGKAIEAYTRMGQVAPQALRDIYTATLPLPPIIAGLGDAWANVGKVAIPTTESIIGPMKQLTKEAAAYEAETQRQADAWNRGERAGQGYAQMTRDVAQQTAQTTQQVVQLNAALGQNATAYDTAIAGAKLLKAYADAGVATSGSIGLGGYDFKQLQQTGVPGGWGGVSWANRTPAPTEAWGRGGATQTTNTLNVNVNTTDATKIAEKLVGEMKHQGYRL